MSIATNRLRKKEDGTEETVTHLLDFIELPHSHSGENMAEALRKVLVEYGIEDKVSRSVIERKKTLTTFYCKDYINYL